MRHRDGTLRAATPEEQLHLTAELEAEPEVVVDYAQKRHTAKLLENQVASAIPSAAGQEQARLGAAAGVV